MGSIVYLRQTDTLRLRHLKLMMEWAFHPIIYTAYGCYCSYKQVGSKGLLVAHIIKTQNRITLALQRQNVQNLFWVGSFELRDTRWVSGTSPPSVSLAGKRREGLESLWDSISILGPTPSRCIHPRRPFASSAPGPLTVPRPKFRHQMSQNTRYLPCSRPFPQRATPATQLSIPPHSRPPRWMEIRAQAAAPPALYSSRFTPETSCLLVQAQQTLPHSTTQRNTPGPCDPPAAFAAALCLPPSTRAPCCNMSQTQHAFCQRSIKHSELKLCVQRAAMPRSLCFQHPTIAHCCIGNQNGHTFRLGSAPHKTPSLHVPRATLPPLPCFPTPIRAQLCHSPCTQHASHLGSKQETMLLLYDQQMALPLPARCSLPTNQWCRSLNPSRRGSCFRLAQQNEPHLCSDSAAVTRSLRRHPQYCISMANYTGKKKRFIDVIEKDGSRY